MKVKELEVYKSDSATTLSCGGEVLFVVMKEKGNMWIRSYVEPSTSNYLFSMYYKLISSRYYLEEVAINQCQIFFNQYIMQFIDQFYDGNEN